MITVYRNAKVYLTYEQRFGKMDFSVEDGKFKEVTYEIKPGDAEVDLNGKYVIPGLIDVHTHGRMGYDFEDIPDEKVAEVLRSYAENGTTAVMGTLASMPYEAFFPAIEKLKDARYKKGIAHMAGIHIEGRYLAEKRRGAHATELLANPSLKELGELLDAIGDIPAHISCAPELPGSEEFIKEAVSRGATVSAAHTDATYEECMKAIEWGVTGFTHTFNAMRPMHHRDPGTVGASLLSDNVYSEFICDGFHIAPEMIKLASRVKKESRIVLITDSLSASGMPDGRYAVGGIPVIVKDGKAINEEGAIAGSTIALIDGLRNFIKFSGVKPEIAVGFATINPAYMMGIQAVYGSIANGKHADFVVVDDPKELNIEQVYVDGEKIR